jgi:hypothetical protein
MKRFTVAAVADYRRQGFCLYDTVAREHLGRPRKFMSTALGLADAFNADPPETAHTALLRREYLDYNRRIR